MNRKIKFRAMILEGKNDAGTWIPITLHLMLHCNFQKDILDINTLSQFTGLKDKNGKEIYEGDIIRYGRNKPKVVEMINERWIPFCSGDEHGYHWNMIEVIGNIYENPELMEKT